MAPKSEVIAGLAGTFMTAVSGSASNSTTFETSQALCSPPSENFFVNGNYLRKPVPNEVSDEAPEEESNESPEEVSDESPEEVSDESPEEELNELDNFVQTIKSMMNTSNLHLWPELEQKLGSIYELYFAGPFGSNSWIEDLNDGLLGDPECPRREMFLFSLTENPDNPQGWPEKIDVYLTEKKATVEFQYNGSDRFSTGPFKYEDVSGVTDVIRMCLKKRQLRKSETSLFE
eukprot:GHVP01061009.1.p1 GENE.GHVP01061009.1~~GHVP01061009.1.p1  ORF type:complete len:232 (+),score=49.49 GHVP01061009.1:619-1314(+)